MRLDRKKVQKIVDDLERKGTVANVTYHLAKDWLDWAQKEKQYLNALRELTAAYKLEADGYAPTRGADE